MGGNNSKASASVVGREDYSSWPLDRVEAAFVRAQVLLTGSQAPIPTSSSAKGEETEEKDAEAKEETEEKDAEAEKEEKAMEEWATKFRNKLRHLTRRQFWEVMSVTYNIIEVKISNNFLCYEMNEQIFTDYSVIKASKQQVLLGNAS